jgi:hypothetical protein
MKLGLIAALALWGTLAGTAGAVGTMADVTVHDRAENRVLPVYRHEGRYYVVGKPGNEYQVRVRNRTGADILTVVSVDGINAVSGDTADWSQTGYVLGSNQSFDIKGWRKSLQRVAAFFFTEHQYSYAARTDRPDNVGVIGVAVFRRKAEQPVYIPRPRHGAPRAESAEPGAGAGASSDSAPRSAESAAAHNAPRSAENATAQRYAPQPVEKSTSLGTGHGRSEASRVTYTAFERATPAPEEVIAIHYDTYGNLVAMGVIRGPRIAAPTPFPGQFVPDPR